MGTIASNLVSKIYDTFETLLIDILRRVVGRDQRIPAIHSIGSSIHSIITRIIRMHQWADSGSERDGDLLALDDSGVEPDQTSIMQVFRMLINSGHINVLSSGEDSDDDDGTDYGDDKLRVRPPKEKYEPDLATINKNDISLIMKDNNCGDTTSALPHLLTKREIGKAGNHIGGFNKTNKAKILAQYLPNCVRKVTNFGVKAFCGTYSSDGSYFLSSAQDRAVRLWDTSRGRFKELKRVEAKDVGWSVLDTAFSPDGQYVAYASWSESIHTFKITGDSEQHDSLSLCPEVRRFCVFSLAFSRDGTEIMGGANDGYLYVYNRDINQRVLKLNAHEEDINCVSFADETSHILFSVADDALVKVWDRRCLNETEPRPVGFMAGHIDGITYVDTKSDGRYLITNSKDQSIKLWDLRAFSSQETVSACQSSMEKHRWDYRWQRVPKRLCVIRDSVPGDTSVMTYRGHSVLNTLVRCRFSPIGSTSQRYVYTGCAAGRVVIYDLLSGEMVKVLDGHDGCVRDVSWHPDYNEIVSTSWDGTLGFWTFASQHLLPGEDADVLGIKVNPQPELRRSSRLAGRRRYEHGGGDNTSVLLDY